MKVLGVSPLDSDATVSLVEGGRVLFAAAEKRFSRQKNTTLVSRNRRSVLL